MEPRYGGRFNDRRRGEFQVEVDVQKGELTFNKAKVTTLAAWEAAARCRWCRRGGGVAPAAATEGAALELAAEIAQHLPEAVARLKRMLHEWDGVEARTAREGEGQVEWQRSGPGLPYRD